MHFQHVNSKMNRILIKLTFLLVWMFSFSRGFASDINWDPEAHQSIRNYYGQCTTYLCPPIQLKQGETYISDSVGIPMSKGNNVEEFRQRMIRAVDEKGLESLIGSHIYVAGIDLHEEAGLQSKYQMVLDELGFREGDIELILWSIPSPLMAKTSGSFVKRLFERIKYWLPGRRDYESPIASEVVTAFTASAVMELPNFFYLRERIENDIDFGLTLTSHFLLLSAFNVFSKSYINWVSRPGSTALEGYLKQMTFSSMFVASYSIFPYSTSIAKQLSEDVMGAVSQLPSEVGRVLSEQSLTAPLQTLFITAIMSWVVGPWTNSQDGEKNSQDARVFRQIAPLPILAWGAVAFAKASGLEDTGAVTVDLPYLPEFSLQAGPFVMNAGHMELLLATATGYVAYKYLMDPAFYVFKFMKSRLTGGIVRKISEVLFSMRGQCSSVLNPKSRR